MKLRTRTMRGIAALLFGALLVSSAPTTALAIEAEADAAIAPSVVAQPLPATAEAGGDASFTVAYAGEPEPSVQWERSVDGGANWAAIGMAENATAASATLQLTQLAAEADGWQYRAQLTSDAGSATSDAAVLAVEAQATAEAPAPVEPESSSEAAAEVEGGTDDAGTGARPVLTGRSAAASSASLVPGTYKVTVNPYIAGSDAPIGVNVYIADSAFPPINPQRMNSTMTVAADGTIDVVVPFNQEIFTMQRVGSGDDVEIVHTERGGTINWMGGAQNPLYTDRITSVTARLGNDSGEYTFSNNMQYPVPLQVEKYWDIHLSVDLANAVRQLEGSFEQTYTDDATGISVTATAEEGSSSISGLQRASLTAAVVADGSALGEAKSALAAAFSNDPGFVLYDIALRADGEDIVLDDRAIAELRIPSGIENPLLYRIDGSGATKLSATVGAGAVAAETRSLGRFAVVDADTATEWAGIKTLSQDGMSLTYSTTGFVEANAFYMSFDMMESFGIYDAFFTRLTEGSAFDSAVTTVEALSSYEAPQIEGIYALALDQNLESFPGATQTHTPFYLLGSPWQTHLTAAVPAMGSGSSLYLLSGTVGGGLTSARQVDARISNGSASFTLAAKDEALDAAGQKAIEGLWNAASGHDGAIHTNRNSDWTDATELSYIAVVHEAPKQVDKPAAAAGLVYTGTPQAGVPDGEGYTLSVVPGGTNAGQYVAVVTLEEGYEWSDGTSEPVTIAWEIAKAQLVATYTDEEVAANGTPWLAVAVTGFVNGETAATARDFSAPRVDAPASLTAGESYTLTPEGGNALNYDFDYRSGTLTVTESIDGSALGAGEYRITANLYVPAEKNDILGLTAYMTNPKNPLVAENDPDYGIPTAPMSDNATLVVDDRGARFLVLDLPNPAFTLMQFGTLPAGISLEGVARDSKTYGPHTGGRITRAVFALDGDSSTYVLAGSTVYAAPLQADKTWDLTLSVDYASAEWISDDTSVDIPGDGTGSGETGGTGNTGGTGGTGGGSSGGTGSTTGAPRADRLQPGTYTVTANIWFSRGDTGLPLDPHITSGVFPPKDPVMNNARLVVASDGTATVRVPIVIQNRIMAVQSISGGGVIATEGGDALSAVTVSLGRIDPNVASITRAMTATVAIGDLAYSIGGPIFGGERQHTWPATLQVVFSGVPTSGGAAVPAMLLSALDQQEQGANAADAERAQRALEAARQANARSQAAASAEQSASQGDGSGPGGSFAPAAIAGGIALLLLASTATALTLRRRSHRTAAAPAPRP